MDGNSSLVRSRRSLAIGTGTTTRRNRVLPAAAVLSQIPQRVGVASSEKISQGIPALTLRGFIAALRHGTAGPKRFDPYTLAVLDAIYSIGNANYDVVSWASGHNVSDLLPWFDVICFHRDAIKVNAALLDALEIPVVALSAPAMPLVIPHTTGAEWGDAILNATEKRVFAIGRAHAQAFNAGGTEIQLAPTQPRTDSKALTIGQRLDRAASKAHVGQLYYTGSAWDSTVGGWAFSAAEISCLLVAPYLQQIASSATVDLSRAMFPTSGTPSSGSINTGYAFPQTAVGLYGVGEVESSGTVYSNLNWWVVWPWRGLVMASRTGFENGNHNTEAFTASASASTDAAGRTLAYTCSNQAEIKTQTTKLFCSQETIPTGVASNPRGSASEYTLDNYGDVLTWSNSPGSPPFPDRGQTGFLYFQWEVPGSQATQTLTTQTISASVQRGTDKLIEILASISKATGQLRQVAAVTPSNFQDRLANPYSSMHTSSGFGISNDVWLHAAPGLSYYKNPSGYWSLMSTAAKAEIQQKFDEQQQGYVGTRCYDYGSAYDSGIYNQYTCSLSSGTTVVSSLVWRTLDYVFLDELNGVAIAIESEFSGSQTTGAAPATLTISLRVQTRHHTVTQQLAQRSYSYGELLPDATIPGTSQRAVPSPQVRAIFAPLWQEQGTFRGAAYITAAEEAATATPAHLFNFRLRLHGYAEIGTINALNETDDIVHFIPCNLLEMLYAFVFSQDYGVGRETSQRYPVTYASRFNDLAGTLFTDLHDVHVRDGVVGPWVAGLNVSTVGIYRT